MGGATGVWWGGVYVDATTAAALTEAHSLLLTHGINLRSRTLQGSYSTSTNASGGTHAGGGAIDIDCTGLTVEQAVLIETTLRKVGFAAWRRPYRAGVWKHHAHGIRIDCRDLSSQAATQVQDYFAGYNGLPIGGRINRDTGTRAYVDQTWADYLKLKLAQEDEVTEADKDEIVSRVITGIVYYKNDLTQNKSLLTHWLSTGANAGTGALSASAARDAIVALSSGFGPEVEKRVKAALADAVVNVNVNFPVSAEPEQ